MTQVPAPAPKPSAEQRAKNVAAMQAQIGELHEARQASVHNALGALRTAGRLYTMEQRLRAIFRQPAPAMSELERRINGEEVAGGALVTPEELERLRGIERDADAVLAEVAKADELRGKYREAMARLEDQKETIRELSEQVAPVSAQAAADAEDAEQDELRELRAEVERLKSLAVGDEAREALIAEREGLVPNAEREELHRQLVEKDAGNAQLRELLKAANERAKDGAKVPGLQAEVKRLTALVDGEGPHPDRKQMIELTAAVVRILKLPKLTKGAIRDIAAEAGVTVDSGDVGERNQAL